MRDRQEVTRVLELQSTGFGASAIAQRTGIPRSTVREWLSGRVPSARSWRARGSRSWDPLPRTYAYLLGVYLGDGCLSAHPRGVYKLRLHLDLRHPQIVDECEAAMRAVCPDNRVHRLPKRSRWTRGDAPTYVELSSYSKRWIELFPQHGPGKKHDRRIELAPWQEDAVVAAPELLLRGLIHSDGCRCINTGRAWRCPRYSFSNRSDDIRRIFCWACDLMDLHWTTAPRTVYVSRKHDVARMDTFIGPKC